jgi:hypothetical protein
MMERKVQNLRRKATQTGLAEERTDDPSDQGGWDDMWQTFSS